MACCLQTEPISRNFKFLGILHRPRIDNTAVLQHLYHIVTVRAVRICHAPRHRTEQRFNILPVAEYFMHHRILGQLFKPGMCQRMDCNLVPGIPKQLHRCLLRKSAVYVSFRINRSFFCKASRIDIKSTFYLSFIQNVHQGPVLFHAIVIAQRQRLRFSLRKSHKYICHCCPFLS